MVSLCSSKPYLIVHYHLDGNLRRDTVSSIGIARSPSLPLSTEGMRHVCYFRHSLALDERRVKFLPEYASGGRSTQMEFGGRIGQLKEVWFAGTHGDV